MECPVVALSWDREWLPWTHQILLRHLNSWIYTAQLIGHSGVCWDGTSHKDCKDSPRARHHTGFFPSFLWYACVIIFVNSLLVYLTLNVVFLTNPLLLLHSLGVKFHYFHDFVEALHLTWHHSLYFHGVWILKPPKKQFQSKIKPLLTSRQDDQSRLSKRNYEQIFKTSVSKFWNEILEFRKNLTYVSLNELIFSSKSAFVILWRFRLGIKCTCTWFSAPNLSASFRIIVVDTILPGVSKAMWRTSVSSFIASVKSNNWWVLVSA